LIVVRILYLCSEYPPQRAAGGIGTYVSVASKLMVAYGHEVHVLACSRGATTSGAIEGGVTVHRRPQIRARGLSWASRSDAFAERIRTALSDAINVRRLGFAPDVIESPEWMAEGLLVRGGTPLVTQLHGPFLSIQTYNGIPLRGLDSTAAKLERRAAARSDLVVSPSADLAEELRRAGWFGRVPVAISDHPIDVAEWGDPTPLTGGGPVVLCVTKLQPLKGIDVLLRAMRRLVDEGHSPIVHIAGASGLGGTYHRELVRMAADLSVECMFLGELDRAAITSAYRTARVVVVPSHFEAYSLVALEAMAAARPVVCGRRAGAAGLIERADAGSVFAPGDDAALAAAVRPYISDRSVAEAAGGRGRAAVVAWSSGAWADHRTALYQRALRKV
jgi:glycogen(starch) synthase